MTCTNGRLENTQWTSRTHHNPTALSRSREMQLHPNNPERHIPIIRRDRPLHPLNIIDSIHHRHRTLIPREAILLLHRHRQIRSSTRRNIETHRRHIPSPINIHRIRTHRRPRRILTRTPHHMINTRIRRRRRKNQRPRHHRPHHSHRHSHLTRKLPNPHSPTETRHFNHCQDRHCAARVTRDLMRRTACFYAEPFPS
ncbi:hypothetical protein Ae168Ps1_6299c [Pseudonocardia sp. Ae168_Ps1]|nr:hypothetical protein Ae150APs1_6169 [Pseudonocardia sp. Ae150A_Ps1]OLL70333.1 hypothetical protein Ae168Ps1_6299c [Pseudonocardia sp. Ae168_Ps1]